MQYHCRKGQAWRIFAVVLAFVLCFSLVVPAVALPGSSGLTAATAYAVEEGDTPDPPDPEPVQTSVPYVVESTVAEARAALQAAGFVVVVEGDDSDTAIVTNQSQYPVAPPGSTITITAKASVAPTIYQVRLGYVDPATDTYINQPGANDVPRIIDKGGKMQMLATVIWSTGSEGYAGDQGVSVSWSVDDPSVATIDNRGMLTALKDGTVTVSCTTQMYGTVTSTIKVDVRGQEGAYVTQVVVTREDGSFYGDDTILFEEYDGTTSVSLYVTVVYSDGTQKCTWKGDRIDNLTWSSSDIDAVYVGEQTGTVKPRNDGSAYVTASVSGGLDGAVSGYVPVMVDTGKYKDGYMPSDSLVVSVVYEADESTVVKEKTYDVSSLSALGINQQAYTQVTSNGNYQTVSAQGVCLSSVMDDLGLKTNEISHFYFSALDGINKAMLSAEYIFGRTGYYFPNANHGWTNGRQPTTPMLAVVSKAVRNVPTADFTDLSEGTRFRLCLGSSDFTDASAQKSYKYLSHIWVVMDGSEQVPPPPPPDPPHDNDSNNSNTLPGTPGSGTGSGTGPGDGTGGALGSGSATPGSSGDSDGEGEGNGGASVDGDGGGLSSRWQVYQMMKKTQSDIDPLDANNPYEPFLLPGMAAVAAAGGGFTVKRYRKELAV